MYTTNRNTKATIRDSKDAIPYLPNPGWGFEFCNRHCEVIGLRFRGKGEVGSLTTPWTPVARGCCIPTFLGDQPFGCFNIASGGA